MPRKPKPGYHDAWAKPLDDASPAKPATVVFTNRSKGTTVHLGDGRKVAPGESAEVSPELAELLA